MGATQAPLLPIMSLILENPALRVSVLDPVADVERLGTRYCAAGYIFQVRDVTLDKDLLAIPDQLERDEAATHGRVWDDGFNVSDGQGIPDSFRGHGMAQTSDGLVLGVGLCTGKTVNEWASWEVTRPTPQSLLFTTTQSGPYGHLSDASVRIERELQLHNRTLISRTRLQSLSGTISIQWYPHPFFPQPVGDELFKLSTAISLPEAGSDGYELGPSGWLARKNWPWVDKENYYQALNHDHAAPLVALHRHPLVGMISARSSYIPALLPVWGNPRTISVEPHLDRTVAQGQSTEWTMEYEFGMCPAAI